MRSKKRSQCWRPLNPITRTLPMVRSSIEEANTAPVPSQCRLPRRCSRAGEKAERAEAERKAAAEAQKIIGIWNARQADGRALWCYPTIGAAIIAGLPWLTFYCPACSSTC
jgi:hypothetical protein